MKVDEILLSGTTTTAGAATVTAEHSVYGWLEQVVTIDGDLADGVDGSLSITD